MAYKYNSQILENIVVELRNDSDVEKKVSENLNIQPGETITLIDKYVDGLIFDSNLLNQDTSGLVGIINGVDKEFNSNLFQNVLLESESEYKKLKEGEENIIVDVKYMMLLKLLKFLQEQQQEIYMFMNQLQLRVV